MSKKTSFYILTESSLKARDLYACRIIEKAFNNGFKVYIYTSTPEETQNFDTQLWTFRDISFVPHAAYTPNTSATAPILIGHTPPPPDSNEILLNLTTTFPQFHSQFNHIIEVIHNDEAIKAAGRKKYQAYQKQGFAMDTFNV